MFYITGISVDFPFFVGELACPWLKYFGDDKRALPWRGELVAALVALSESSHQVTDPECSASDTSIMVASQSLLVLGQV